MSRPDDRSAGLLPGEPHASGCALTLSVLGIPHVRRGRETLTLPTRKSLWLLAYLHLEGPQDRGHLADLFWGDSGGGEEQARASLRSELHRLRGTPAAACLNVSKTQVGVTEVACDLDEYLALLNAGRASEAQTLVRGELLSGATGSPAFDEWLRRRRDALASWRADALAAHARAREAAGDLRGALGTWLALLAGDELAEGWQREAMRLHGVLGERAQALSRYERLREVLLRDLGLDPLPETVQLAHALRVGEAGTSALTAPNPAPTLAQLPLVGRGAVFRRLEARPVGLTVLLGEPGVGKTRLAEDLAATRGAGLALRGAELAAHTPLAPLLGPLRAAWQAGRLAGLHEGDRAELARLLPEVGPASVPDPSPAGRARFLQALGDTVRRCLQQGEILLIDDLQWVDDTTLEVITLTLAALVRERLVLVTARPAELTGSPATALDTWGRITPMTQETLEPLDETDLLTLVRRVAGVAGGELFTRRLYGVTAGNPLFVLETLRGLLEAGEITVGEAGWLTPYDDVTEDYAELPMAPSVRAAVLARADRLGPETRRVLDAACLAGEVFSLRELAGATALDDWTGLAALERAERAGLLVAGPEGHRFSHALVRRALQEALGASRRQLVRRRLAETLITLDGDPVTIAQHLAADPAAAAPWWHQAAATARARYAAPAARDYLDRALACLPEPAQGQSDPRRVAWLLERTDLAHALGDRAAEKADLATLGRLAYSDLERGRVALARARFLSEDGQPALAMQAAQDAAVHLERAGDARGQYEAELCLAEMAYYQEQFALALHHSQAAVSLARGLDPAALAGALNWLGILCDTTLDPQGALAAFGEALALRPDPYLAARLHNNRATVYSLYGCFPQGLHDLDQALTLIRRGDFRHLEGFVLDTRVRVLRGLGRLDEAQADLERALAIGRELDSHRLVSHLLHHRVLLLNGQGKHHAVLVAAQEALHVAGATQSTTDQIFTLTGRSEAHLALGDVEAALRDAREAARLFGPAQGVREGLPFFVWWCLVRALTAAGLEDEAAPLRGQALSELNALTEKLTDPALRNALLALPECRGLHLAEAPDLR